MTSPAPVDASPAAPGAARLLVVDDNVDAAETLSAVLGSVGYEVHTAADARQALALAAGLPPDLAVLDIGLPGMDGYQLAGELRARHGTPRLIALTGFGGPEHHARAKEAGFDAHLVKPVAFDRLLETIQDLLANR